eukprot:3319698-Amphidinium_carterae.1
MELLMLFVVILLAALQLLQHCLAILDIVLCSPKLQSEIFRFFESKLSHLKLALQSVDTGIRVADLLAQKLLGLRLLAFL